LDHLSLTPNLDVLVAIGASAGGLEALELFFRNCPTDLGVTYVVVQHLSPDHKSMMDDLLSRYTTMPVCMVSSDQIPQPDTIYLIPAGTHIEIEEGHFKVTRKLPHTFSLPIDIFFKSVAKAYGNRAVAIVLSGTGSDGSLGIKDVNAVGGLVLVQTPADARFDGMPTSAIQTGLVHDILPARELPSRLHAYLHQPNAIHSTIELDANSNLDADAGLNEILDLLNNEYQINFAEYKPGTVNRRIERRMQMLNYKTVQAYRDYLQQNTAELNKLRLELLIPVTSFFRDQRAFDLLDSAVINKLVENANPNADLRVWVAGCSTGEEAYSIAMLFHEAFKNHKQWIQLKIFATDVNQDNLDQASAGFYPPTIVSELTPERLDAFFDLVQDGFKVKPFLRQSIVFARHNLLNDAPFTRMHLVTCRNTLIYFKNEAQAVALQKLQFAVLPQHYLMLGISESIMVNNQCFNVLDNKLKIFQRNATPLQQELRGRFSINTARSIKERSLLVRPAGQHAPYNTADKAREILLTDYAPPSLLVDSSGKVLHLFGAIKSLLQFRNGAAEMTVSRILPDPLVAVCSALIHKCKRENGQFRSENVRIKGLQARDLSCQVVAKFLPVEPDGHILLSFIIDESSDNQAAPIELPNELTEKISTLEQELQATRESLQATIEELETSNEELQATNEELMASNEEMQSSNEELQSVNEELNTVNAEYHEKMAILNRINADLDSMSRASGIASIFVDQYRNITRFTADALRLFKLREMDIGRPIDEIVSSLDYTDLSQDIATTLAQERTIEKEIRSTDGRDFLMRILPYRITSGMIGAVTSFIDITPLKVSEQLQLLLNALPEHIAVLDKYGNIVLVNSAWEQFARVNGDPTVSHTSVGTNYLKCCEKSMMQDPLAHKAYLGIKGILEGSRSRFQLSYPCHSPAENRWFVMNAVTVKHSHFAAIISHFNVTDWMVKEVVND